MNIEDKGHRQLALTLNDLEDGVLVLCKELAQGELRKAASVAVEIGPLAKVRANLLCASEAVVADPVKSAQLHTAAYKTHYMNIRTTEHIA